MSLKSRRNQIKFCHGSCGLPICYRPFAIDYRLLAIRSEAASLAKFCLGSCSLPICCLPFAIDYRLLAIRSEAASLAKFCLGSCSLPICCLPSAIDYWLLAIRSEAASLDKFCLGSCSLPICCLLFGIGYRLLAILSEAASLASKVPTYAFGASPPPKWTAMPTRTPDSSGRPRTAPGLPDESGVPVVFSRCALHLPSDRKVVAAVSLFS